MHHEVDTSRRWSDRFIRSDMIPLISPTVLTFFVFILSMLATYINTQPTQPENWVSPWPRPLPCSHGTEHGGDSSVPYIYLFHHDEWYSTIPPCVTLKLGVANDCLLWWPNLYVDMFMFVFHSTLQALSAFIGNLQIKIMPTHFIFIGCD
jgi:hypothetical protein